MDNTVLQGLAVSSSNTDFKCEGTSVEKLTQEGLAGPLDPLNFSPSSYTLYNIYYHLKFDHCPKVWLKSDSVLCKISRIAPSFVKCHA